VASTHDTRDTRSAATEVAEWLRCPSCHELIYAKRLRRYLGVCTGCGVHQRLPARERISQLADAGSFQEFEAWLPASDPLEFVDSRPYQERLASARTATGEQEAVVCGEATVDGHRLVLAVMDFRFLGGSLGTGAGELLVLAAECALRDRLPLLVVTASGGARMQEGVLSLLQMAKVSQAIARLGEAGLLFITLITDPTYGGVAASFATQADVIIAEPGARLGFAGPRVIRDTLRAKLPPGFQTAEFLLAHGAIDMIAERGRLREVVATLLRLASDDRPDRPLTGPGQHDGLVTDPAAPHARSAWEAVGLARHPGRPTGREYIGLLCDSFIELHGDRLQADSPSIIGGIANLAGTSVMAVATQKGHTTRELVDTNFGMAGPEGYRKALRLFRLAERLRIPVVTLIDTPGAYPGVAAEENGQASAIAANILALTALRVPVVCVITGEGGSGGALALAAGDRVLMFEHSVYSVISPEGCAAILWDASATAQAATALRLTADDLLRLGVIDGVIAEPGAGTHTDPVAAASRLGAAVRGCLAELHEIPADQLIAQRRKRLRDMGSPGMCKATGSERVFAG
jgi:acyl-CoA carboxylase subunit beta